MSPPKATYLPDGEQLETTSFGSRAMTFYAEDQITVPGIATFGYRNKVALDEDIPWHYHRNRFEFHYLIQGILSFVVDGEEYDLHNGAVFVTFPNERHKTGSQNVMRHIFWFSVEDGEDILGLGKEASALLLGQLHALQNRVIPVGKEMQLLFSEIFENITSTQPTKQLCARLQMASALCKITEYDRKLLEHRTSPEITLALDFIEQNKCRSIPLEEIARHCHLSLSHFSTRFKREVGITPSFYIQKKRIECAKELLRQGCSVTDTALDLGFSSSDYFTVVFRRIALMTPTEYIRKVRKETAGEE